MKTVENNHEKLTKELQRVNEYLDTILFNLPAGVAILEGPEFRYFKINRMLAEINGLTVDDHLGRPLKEVLPNAAADIIPRLQKVLETGKPSLNFEFSTKLPKDPNEIRHFIDSFFPIREKDGKIRAVGAVVLDITERKQSEMELINSKGELERKNIALNEVIGQVEIEKQNIRENVTENVDKVLLPILKRLKLKGESKKYVHLLESHLKDLVSSYGKMISLKKSSYMKF